MCFEVKKNFKTIYIKKEQNTTTAMKDKDFKVCQHHLTFSNFGTWFLSN